MDVVQDYAGGPKARFRYGRIEEWQLVLGEDLVV
jgi:hypothetical protein